MTKKKIQKKEILTEEILRLRLIPIEQYSSITVGAVELLAIKGAHKFFNYDDYDESSLDWLKDLPDDAALKLGKSKAYCALSLNGLNSLSDKGAEALSKFIGEELSLNGLTALSETRAMALAKFKGKKLSLNGLTTLSDKATQALSKFEGSLFLDSLESLSDTAAKAFSKKKISLMGLKRYKYSGKKRGLGSTEEAISSAALSVLKQGAISKKNILVPSSIYEAIKTTKKR